MLQSDAHELGHSLGLLHSNKYGAMMSPYHRVSLEKKSIKLYVMSTFQGWKPNLSLDSDDIRAVKALYGNQVLRATSSRSSPYQRPTTRKPTTRKPTIRKLTTKRPRNYYYYELLKK